MGWQFVWADPARLRVAASVQPGRGRILPQHCPASRWHGDDLGRWRVGTDGDSCQSFGRGAGGRRLPALDRREERWNRGVLGCGNDQQRLQPAIRTVDRADEPDGCPAGCRWRIPHGGPEAGWHGALLGRRHQQHRFQSAVRAVDRAFWPLGHHAGRCRVLAHHRAAIEWNGGVLGCGHLEHWTQSRSGPVDRADGPGRHHAGCRRRISHRRAEAGWRSGGLGIKLQRAAHGSLLARRREAGRRGQRAHDRPQAGRFGRVLRCGHDLRNLQPHLRTIRRALGSLGRDTGRRRRDAHGGCEVGWSGAGLGL